MDIIPVSFRKLSTELQAWTPARTLSHRTVKEDIATTGVWARFLAIKLQAMAGFTKKVAIRAVLLHPLAHDLYLFFLWINGYKVDQERKYHPPIGWKRVFRDEHRVKAVEPTRRPGQEGGKP